MGIGAVLVAAPVTGSPFSLGVNAGEVVPSAAVLWAHASPGAVRVEVARDSRFDGLVFSRAARTERAHDGTVRVKVTGLRPGTSYFYSFAALQRLRSSTGLYSHWDNHEFINDFTRAENGAVYAAGARAFTDYAPVTYTSKNGLYRTSPTSRGSRARQS
jgi:phosphodiesterase/alkaline phosphatase D-like protein